MYVSVDFELVVVILVKTNKQKIATPNQALDQIVMKRKKMHVTALKFINGLLDMRSIWMFQKGLVVIYVIS